MTLQTSNYCDITQNNNALSHSLLDWTKELFRSGIHLPQVHDCWSPKNNNNNNNNNTTKTLARHNQPNFSTRRDMTVITHVLPKKSISKDQNQFSYS